MTTKSSPINRIYSKRRASTLWPPAQEQILRKHYPHASWDRLLTLLPGYTRAQIASRATRIGVTRHPVPPEGRQARPRKVTNGAASRRRENYSPSDDAAPMRPGATAHEGVPSRRGDMLYYRDGRVVAMEQRA